LKACSLNRVEDEEETVVRKLSSNTDGIHMMSRPASPIHQPLTPTSHAQGDDNSLDCSAAEDDEVTDYRHENDQDQHAPEPGLPTTGTAPEQPDYQSPAISPPYTPFAPNGPSSPIENAFARLAATAPSHDNIDPRLLDNSMNQAPLTDYQLPGAVVDEVLATQSLPPQKMTQPAKKQWKPRRKGTKSGDTENLEVGATQHTLTAAQKGAATRAANRAAEEARAMEAAKDPTRGRKRKGRLNWEGGEFEKPKKARRR
jgi:hypothetical protein